MITITSPIYRMDGAKKQNKIIYKLPFKIFIIIFCRAYKSILSHAKVAIPNTDVTKLIIIPEKTHKNKISTSDFNFTGTFNIVSTFIIIQAIGTNKITAKIVFEINKDENMLLASLIFPLVLAIVKNLDAIEFSDTVNIVK